MDVTTVPVDPEPEAPAPEREGDEGRVVAGVAGALADRLGLDPLWVRMAFVVLALYGGVGLPLYAAGWLMFRSEGDPSRRWQRWLAGAVAAVTVLSVGAMDGPRFASGGFAVVALLAGLAASLWRPAAPPAPARPVPAFVDAAVPARPRTARAPRAPRRPPSVLGRATLGAAVIVAGVGGLVDSLNGGRLHPEQWLGAGAVACGLGLLVGTFLGRARWLVLPAVAFAGAGWLWGVGATVGVNPLDGIGDRYDWLGTGSSGDLEVRRLAGSASVDVQGRPDRPVAVDAAIGFGSLRLWVTDDVTVSVPDLDGPARVFVDGALQPRGPVLVGPGERADVEVDARLAHGDVHVFRTGPGPELPDLPDVPDVPDLSGRPDLSVSADGLVVALPDGRVLLAGGEAVLGPGNGVLVGNAYEAGPGIVGLATSEGDFQVLPDGMLLGPDGSVYDLDAQRQEATDG